MNLIARSASDLAFQGRQRGVTLIEMMIAFALSAVLIIGVVKIFDSNKFAFNMQSGVARVQESGRVVSELMARDIRNAGFMGCGTGASINNIVKFSATRAGQPVFPDSMVNHMLDIYSSNQSILGFDNVGTIANGSVLDGYGLAVGTATGNVKSGTDVILLQHAAACDGGKVVGTNTNATANIKIENAVTCNLQQDDIVIVSNCASTDMFAITNDPTNSNAANKDTLTHATNTNTDNKLGGEYGEDSYIYKPVAKLFYVGYGASGEPTLFVRSLNDEHAATAFASYELAEGVVNMQILYGEDTNGDFSADRYVPAGTSGLDMNNVMAVRVAYEVQSDTGASTFSTDNRIDQIYQTTVAIRSRVK